jgi:hypothetical protein
MNSVIQMSYGVFRVLGHVDISNAPYHTTVKRLIFEQRLSLYTRFSKIPMTF